MTKHHTILTKEQAEVNLIENLPHDIKMLSNFFELDGKKLYLVGGCVRDTFLGKHPKDYDLCTDALPDTVIKILEKAKIISNLQGEHFAVVVAKMDDGDYEIATFREDVSYSDNRHPEIRLGVTIKQDVLRRDFTINALFMDLQERTIIDLVNGIDDLKNGIVRCVGNPVDRFKEDHLRKLRAIRFATRLCFEIHDDTFIAIYNDPDLNISADRIFNLSNGELMNIFKTCKDPAELIFHLYETRLVNQIFRGLLVNDKEDINYKQICSFTTLIAAIVCPCNKNLVKTLILDKKIDAKTAEGVGFLLNNEPLDKIKPLLFFNKRKSTNLTDSEIIIFNNETDAIIWLTYFKPDPELSQKMMDQGYSGKELGDLINQYYQNEFLLAIDYNY